MPNTQEIRTIKYNFLIKSSKSKLLHRYRFIATIGGNAIDKYKI